MSELSITLRLENWDESRPLTREEAVEILNLPEEEMPKLLDCAYALRTKFNKCAQWKLFPELCVLCTVS